MRYAVRFASVLITSGLLAPPAASLLYVLQPDEDLVRESPVVVYGEVTATVPARLDNRPATDAFVRVERVLKGLVPGNGVTVRQPGGVADRVGFEVMGLPMLATGHRVLLFLDEQDGVHRTVHLGLGIFFETRHLGRTVLVREAPHVKIGQIAEERVARDSAQFRRWIADQVAGRDHRADYFVDFSDEPRTVASPYGTRVVLHDCLPEQSTATVRWRDFDRGGTLTFALLGSQEGVTDTMAGVRAAMDAWTGSGAGVSLAAVAIKKEDKRKYKAVFEFGTSTNGSSRVLAEGMMAYTVLCDPEDDEVLGPWAMHRIPGTDKLAFSAAVAVIKTTPALVNELAIAGSGAAATFAQVMTHEMGHALALLHSQDRDATMWTTLQRDGRGASLRPDDVNGIQFLYPPLPRSGGVEDEPPPPDDTRQESGVFVAPYWAGPSGGFAVMPAEGRSAVTVTCGRATTEYGAEDGIVTRLIRGTCSGTGLRIEGAVAGGWYWQNGDENAAVSVLVREGHLAQASGSASSESAGAVVPGGVTARATDTGTWIEHDTSRLVGIVPHLSDNECSEYVTPYWRGHGGIVARPEEGRDSVKVRVQCGRTHSTTTLTAGEDGIAVGLLRQDYCLDREGNPKEGRLTVKAAAPGGWYWIKGEKNAAVAPLMCAELLAGPEAVVPGGVLSWAVEDGTYFKHETAKLIGIVPHISPGTAK